MVPIHGTKALVVGTLLAASCGTLPSGERWGTGATLRPGKERVLQAARDALVDPWTWVPVAGAAVFAVDDWDDEISDWAREERPIFGDRKGALQGADELRNLAQGAWVASVLATPSGDGSAEWLADKARGGGVQWVATITAKHSTSLLKPWTNKRTPNGSDNRSFPSGHVTDSFAATALVRQNLESIDVAPAVRGSLEVGVVGLAAGSAWARVEAGAHHPSDVLGSAALGNFVARFVHDAFLELPRGTRITTSVDPDEWAIGLALSF